MRPTIFKNTGILAVLAIFLLSACTNIQNAVDKGQYDLAIKTATKKLRGKTRKKAKYVAALEEAFDKANEIDLARIDYLKRKNDADSWEKVFHTANSIAHRQNLVSPILPVLKEEGYKAKFAFVNTSNILIEARAMASELFYAEGNAHLAIAERGNKNAARIAYELFTKVKKYDRNYKDVIELTALSHELGIVHIGYKVANRTNGFLPGSVRNHLTNINTNNLNTFWEQYHIGPINFEPDYMMVLNIENIKLGPEQVNEKEYQEKKRISTGFKPVKPKKETAKAANSIDGNRVAKGDTLQKKEMVETFKWVTADVLRTTQTRLGVMHAVMVVRNMKTNTIVSRRKFEGTTVFENCFVEFWGDRRALSPATVKHLRNKPLPFPSDHKMLLDATCQLMPNVKRVIGGINLG